jgi:hypothetical protein
LQRSLREIASEGVELSASKDTRNNGEAVFHVMRFTVPHNVQFSGRATTCNARRERTVATPRSRRARDWVSRSAATAGYAAAVT